MLTALRPHLVVQGDLCAYMLQEYKEKQDTARRCKQVAFTLPATTTPCQGVPIVNIHPAHDDTIVTVQEDGTVCCWSPELKPLKTKHMFVCFNSYAFITLKMNLVPFCAFLIVIKRPTLYLSSHYSILMHSPWLISMCESGSRI